MPNRKHLYYVGDDVTFRGSFKVDDVAQTPDAGTGTAKIMKRDTAAAVISTTATISDTQLQYKYTPLVIGRFAMLGLELETRSGKGYLPDKKEGNFQ